MITSLSPLTLQVLEGVFARRVPLGQRFELRRRDLVADLGFAVIDTQAETLQIRATCRLADLRRREEHLEPQVVRLVVARAEDLLRLRRQRGHAFASRVQELRRRGLVTVLGH
jgi:hypothetical protein